MKKALIYQIGRLDMNLFDEKEFIINNKSFKRTLSCLAIRDFLTDKGLKTETILIYPVSLPFNQSLLSQERFKHQCPKNLYQSIVYAMYNSSEYLNKPLNLFHNHPHSNECDDFVVIHSLGLYKTCDSDVDFESYYSDIVLEIFIDMLSRYLKDEKEIERIIVDISSGHNIYVSALLDGFRNFSVWLDLYNWLNKSPVMELAFADPSLTFTKECKINFEQQKAKKFFSSPFKFNDIINRPISKNIYPDKELRGKKKILQYILEGFMLTFSAIKNNIPLVIYRFGFHKRKKVKDLIYELIEHTKLKLFENYIHSPGLDKRIYLNLFLTCGLYLGIIKVLEHYGVIKGDKNGVNLKKIKNSFDEIYTIFGIDLNKVILGNEIYKIESGVEKSDEWKQLIELLYEDAQVKESPDNKRNFFAHAGFEANITECRFINGNFYLRYRDKGLNNIKKWLYESV